jgi:flagellar biosynthetic protein FlhB
MIMPNPPLARVLFDTVEIDESVPPEHYKAVAEIISYVFRAKGKLK